jgi:hypothetical protein
VYSAEGAKSGKPRASEGSASTRSAALGGRKQNGER